MELILIIILILLLLGAFPFGRSRGWRWRRYGLWQIVLLILIIWLIVRIA
jgi:hypothetical protein